MKKILSLAAVFGLLGIMDVHAACTLPTSFTQAQVRLIAQGKAVGSCTYSLSANKSVVQHQFNLTFRNTTNTLNRQGALHGTYYLYCIPNAAPCLADGKNGIYLSTSQSSIKTSSPTFKSAPSQARQPR